jgi:hypothetical protein
MNHNTKEIVKYIEDGRLAEQTIIEMLDAGFDYFAIAEYCQEMFGDAVWKHLAKKSDNIETYLKAWRKKELKPYPLPPYYA